MSKEIYLTQEGLEEIKKELEYLKTEKRPEVIEALKEARALGDLSENAEYDAARAEQGQVESRIVELEKMIEKAIVIKEENNGKVSIGTTVKIEYLADSEIETYTIVGTNEADPFENRISNESPLAQAIIGLKKDEKATVLCEAGNYEVKVIDIL